MALDEVMKHLNEAAKAKAFMDIIDPVFVELNKAYYEKMARKTRELIK